MSEIDAERLEKFLRQTGPMSIKWAAHLLDLYPRYVYELVKKHPGKFDVVGICGHFSTYCISITDSDRPIQLVKEDA